MQGTNMAKLTDEEFGAKLVAAYRAYRDLHEAGALGSDAEHPRDTVNDWISTIRDCKANDEGGLGPIHIMKRGAQDNPPDFQGKPENPTLSVPPKATQDGQPQSRYSVGTDNVPRFERQIIGADGRPQFENGKPLFEVLRGNDALVARAAQSNPGAVRVMKTKIAGYDRLK